MTGAVFLPTPLDEVDLLGLLDVQVMTVEEVSLAGATDVDPRVSRTGSEDEQAEEADGEAALQRPAVKNAAGVHQLVSLVISQDSGTLGLIQMFPVEPDDRLDLKHRKPGGNWEEKWCVAGTGCLLL